MSQNINKEWRHTGLFGGWEGLNVGFFIYNPTC